MPIEVHCDCGKVYDVGPEMSGKKLRCKACGIVLKVPLVPLEESAEVPPGGASSSNKADFEVVPPGTEPEPPPVSCPACGSPSKKGDTVCLACGAELGTSGPALLEKVPRPVLIGGGAFVLVLIVALIIGKVWYGTRDAHFTELGWDKLKTDPRAARAEFEKALKYNAAYVDAHLGLVEVGTQLKDWRLVESSASSAARLMPSGTRRAATRITLARALIELKQPSRARDAARAAVEDDATVDGAEELIGLAALDMGEKDAAEEKLKAAQSRGSKDPRVYRGLARLAVEKKDYESASTFIFKAADCAQDDAQLWLEAARIQGLAGKDRAAQKASLAKAAKADPKSAEIQLMIARICLEEKDWEQAKAYAETVKGLAPEAAGGPAALGEALLEMGNAALAKPELEQALKLGKPGPDDDVLSRAELLLGRALIQLGDKGPGLERLERALRKRDKDLKAHLDVGDLALSIGKPDVAARVLDGALRIDPKCYEAHISLARALARLEGGRKSSAGRISDLLKDAIAVDPKRLEAYLELGQNWDALGDYARAIEAYEAGIKQFPKEPELWYQLGRACNRARSWDKAIDAFQNAGDYKDSKDQLIQAKDKKRFE
jgi:tetratricopeptide (TPR) repeat protein